MRATQSIPLRTTRWSWRGIPTTGLRGGNRWRTNPHSASLNSPPRGAIAGTRGAGGVTVGPSAPAPRHPLLVEQGPWYRDRLLRRLVPDPHRYDAFLDLRRHRRGAPPLDSSGGRKRSSSIPMGCDASPPRGGHGDRIPHGGRRSGAPGRLRSGEGRPRPRGPGDVRVRYVRALREGPAGRRDVGAAATRRASSRAPAAALHRAERTRRGRIFLARRPRG